MDFQVSSSNNSKINKFRGIFSNFIYDEINFNKNEYQIYFIHYLCLYLFNKYIIFDEINNKNIAKYCYVPYALRNMYCYTLSFFKEY